jgi:hypothetical protein
MTAEIGLALRPAEAVALRADSCISPDAAGDSWHSRDPSPGRRGPGPVTEPHASPAASNTGRTALSEQYRSPAACPSPALAPARFRVRRRWAAVPGCPRRPAQREPLRPDLAPGPRRSHAGGRDRPPAGAPPLRSARYRTVAVTGLRRPARRDRGPLRHSVRVLLTIYAHGIPDCDQIASQHIEQALRPSHWPPAGTQNRRRRQESGPSCVRATAGRNGTQLHPKPPSRSDTRL